MFPFDLEEEEELEEVIEVSKARDYEIDFEKGKLTGRMVEGIEAVKQWVRIALHVDRYVFRQYSWNFGNEFSTLIGKGYNKEYIETEAYRMVVDALSIEESVLGIEDFTCNFDDDNLTVSFTLKTIYGEEDMNVRG